MPDDRLDRAIAMIDAANADDPNRIAWKGEDRPKELLHAELVTAWIGRLHPDASEALLIAARGHHICRWTSPRSSYPAGRAAYLRWRRDLSQQQADRVRQLLNSVHYADETIDRVCAIMTKRNLGHDPDVQALEDAMCLVFLETQFDELSGRLDDTRMTEVLRKTMSKMSRPALGLVEDLPLSVRARELIAKASAPD